VSPDPRSRRGVWIGGVAVGLSSAFLALSFPVVGYAIALLFVGGAVVGRGTMSAIGGLGLGFGSAWLGLIANAAGRCDPASCTPPDLAPWLFVGGGMLLGGMGLSVLAAARR
jgi:hypothetical protein